MNVINIEHISKIYAEKKYIRKRDKQMHKINNKKDIKKDVEQ